MNPPGSGVNTTDPDIETTTHLSGRPIRWLRLRCNGQIYALELLKVQEVVRPAPLLTLRGTSPAMLGVMNLRGQVVPLLDLGVYLDSGPISPDMQTHPETRVVVIEEHGEVMGLLVSVVEDVTNLYADEIESPRRSRPGGSEDGVFCGIARQETQTLILLNASVLLQAA